MTAPPTTVTSAEGVSSLFVGLRVGFSEPAIRKVMLASLVVNAVVFAAIFTAMVWGIVTWTPEANTGWTLIDWVLDAFAWVIQAALILAALFVAPTVFNLLAGIVLPMFQTPVYNAARAWAGGPPVPEAPGGVRVTAAMVLVEVRRLLRLVGFSLLALLLNLIPGIGTLAYLVVQFLIAARTTGWDLMAYHFELHGLSYAKQLAFLTERRGLTQSLGAVANLLCMIPVMQLVFVTTNVVGAGILSARLDGAAPRQ